MPKVTIEFTPEEKVSINAEARRAGCACCPVCGDSIRLKPFHEVRYESGTIELDNVNRYAREKPTFVVGHKAQMIMCEECWTKSSMEQRMAECRKIFDDRKAGVRRVNLARNDKTGGFEDCPKDTIRRQKELAAIDEIQNAVLGVIQGGG